MAEPTTLYQPDIRVDAPGRYSTVYTVEPLTDVGRQWLRERVATEPYQWFGDQIVVEHRYIMDLVAGMVDEGLTVEGI